MDIKFYVFSAKMWIFLTTLLCCALELATEPNGPYSNIQLTIREGWELTWTCSSPHTRMEALYDRNDPSSYKKIPSPRATTTRDYGTHYIGNVSLALLKDGRAQYKCTHTNGNHGHYLNLAITNATEECRAKENYVMTLNCSIKANGAVDLVMRWTQDNWIALPGTDSTGDGGIPLISVYFNGNQQVNESCCSCALTTEIRNILTDSTSSASRWTKDTSVEFTSELNNSMYSISNILATSTIKSHGSFDITSSISINHTSRQSLDDTSRPTDGFSISNAHLSNRPTIYLNFTKDGNIYKLFSRSIIDGKTICGGNDHMNKSNDFISTGENMKTGIHDSFTDSAITSEPSAHCCSSDKSFSAKDDTPPGHLLHILFVLIPMVILIVAIAAILAVLQKMRASIARSMELASSNRPQSEVERRYKRRSQVTSFLFRISRIKETAGQPEYDIIDVEPAVKTNQLPSLPGRPSDKISGLTPHLAPEKYPCDDDEVPVYAETKININSATLHNGPSVINKSTSSFSSNPTPPVFTDEILPVYAESNKSKVGHNRLQSQSDRAAASQPYGVMNHPISSLNNSEAPVYSQSSKQTTSTKANDNESSTFEETESAYNLENSGCSREVEGSTQETDDVNRKEAQLASPDEYYDTHIIKPKDQKQSKYETMNEEEIYSTID